MPMDGINMVEISQYLDFRKFQTQLGIRKFCKVVYILRGADGRRFCSIYEYFALIFCVFLTYFLYFFFLCSIACAMRRIV
jgi:hypothetical protein